MRQVTRGLALAVALLAACGGGVDETKARIRLVNASAYATLDMSIDDSQRFSAVGYGQTPSYVEAGPDADEMDTVIRRAGAASALVSLTPAVQEDQLYTVLAWGREGELKALVLDDNAGQPDAGKTLLRVVNAAPDAGPLDVYLTGSAETLVDAVALNAGLAIGALSPYSTVDSATWRLRVTAAGSKADVRLDFGNLNLASRGISTLVLTPSRGGVLVNALLLADRGDSITRADGTQARVRVAAAVSDGGSVSAAVGGTTLLSGIGAPAVGGYALVTAGTPATVVSVNGSAVVAPAPTLDAGTDYTLLVYGPLTAPALAWLPDDNRLPTTGDARVRLVHGVAGIAGTLSMSVDFTPLADGVAPGTASPYGTLDATTTAQLSVTAAGVATPLFSAIEQTFAADSVYTVFLAGSASAPVGIVRRDR